MKKILLLSISLLIFISVFGISKEVTAQPDLYISEFSLNPPTPTQSTRVGVRVGVYNKGNAMCGAFTVEWWPGENYTDPGYTWRVNGLPARGGQILQCNYFYPSWYSKLVTKAVADSKGEVQELNEKNNARRMRIRVLKTEEAATQPDLYISEFSLKPSTPTQGSRVGVRVGVYNKGNARSGAFTVEWWPGENYTDPGCTWRVNGVAAKGGKILKCTYFYPSWYPEIITKAVADSEGEVRELNENNNARGMRIRVLKP